jgi:hypothetical protein
MKNRLTLLLLVQLVLAGTAWADEYPSFTIPKGLLKYANSVIRKQETIMEIHSEKKVTIREHFVLTVLNEAGARYAYWSDTYDKMSSIDKIEGNLYNAMGQKIRSLKKSEITDYPVQGAGQMIVDDRVKYHSFEHREYPYTIEYISETTNNQTMFLPGWSPIRGRGMAVENSSFVIISDPAYTYRTKIWNIPGKPISTNNGKKKTEIWQISQLSAVPAEYGAPPIHEVAPYVVLGASTFKFGNYKGDMSTWSEFGNFVKTLNNGQDELPEEEKQKVKAIAATCQTDREKVDKLYRYMQSKTHYVGIQLGVGGWVPFPANYVATKGYGDCKALSNYMVAILKEVGIKSYYVLIRAGKDERDIPLDFPSSSFNHAICAVPLGKDTTWLECTSQTTAPGYMGSFTGNRHALLITENGGVLVKTPKYDKTTNQYHSSITATLNKEGQLTITANNRYKAMLGDDLHHFLHSNSNEEKQKILQRSLDLPQYTIRAFDYKETPGDIPVIDEQLSITADHYAQFTGKRLFIVPNVLNKWQHKLTADTNRLFDIILNEEKIEIDTVRINLPEGYKIERDLKVNQLNTPFGSYEVSTQIQNNTILYIRRLELSKGRFPAKMYNELLLFYEKIYNADRAKLVFVKEEA